MKISATPVAGAFVIDVERHEDARGFFARTVCLREFAAAGIGDAFVQGSVSHNKRRGTLRGLHFQWPPSKESKLVSCGRGGIFDALVDLRPGSPSYLKSFGAELSEANDRALYIPWGCAHGFLTLTDASDVNYLMTDYYQPEAGDGVRWNDPAFAIQWPATVTEIIERDARYADFDDAIHRTRFAAALRKGQS